MTAFKDIKRGLADFKLIFPEIWLFRLIRLLWLFRLLRLIRLLWLFRLFRLIRLLWLFWLLVTFSANDLPHLPDSVELSIPAGR